MVRQEGLSNILRVRAGHEGPDTSTVSIYWHPACIRTDGFRLLVQSRQATHTCVATPCCQGGHGQPHKASLLPNWGGPQGAKWVI